jgi:hypothetical protein
MDNQEGASWFEKNKAVFIFLGAFFILSVVIVMVFFAIKMVDESKKASETKPRPDAIAAPEETKASSSVPVLPGAPETGKIGAGGNEAVSEWAAEKINFGDYYRPAKETLEIGAPPFSLPLNAKTDIANYYEVNRKINLDSALSGLNAGAFAVLDNPFSSSADNFYEVYGLLDSRGVPTLITGDFLVYYYEAVLDKAYKEIESSVFYDNLWETSNRLFRQAKERYEKNLEANQAGGDVYLEASRLEAAYFAVALSLLEPTPEQVSREGGLSKVAGFSQAEADEFLFEPPDYLKSDVGEEVRLIKSAAASAKSPLLLYERDYKNFAVPEAYKNNSRLYNFYLASRWLNSLLPLFYKDASCPRCLLDKDDWRINMAAAFYIAEDLAADQDLRNRWAKIYKIQSFFGGLRADLNYLDYLRSFGEIFGSDKKIEEALGKNNEEIDANLLKLRERLLKIGFSAIEGGLSRTATSTRPLLGLKMLADAYSPDDYISSELNYPQTGLFRGKDKDAEKIATACKLQQPEGFYRCFGSAFDGLNLVYPLGRPLSGYFFANADYENYENQAQNLRRQLADFTVNSWHNNNYWATMDMAAKFLTAPERKKIVFMDNDAWQEKDIKAAAAYLAGLKLPADVLVPREGAGDSRLDQSDGTNPYADYKYIEPSLTLARELFYNAEMISQTLSLLEAGAGGDAALSDLGELKKNLETVAAIISKELKSEDLGEGDYEFINNFTREFEVKVKGDKILKFLSPYSGENMSGNLTGVKLLILTYQRGGKKILAAGPVFNYREERK